MSKAPPDAWEDEWSSTADKLPTPPTETEAKRVSSKVTKAQRRAQQAEFNRQLWAEAEGPRETNYFLESRNIVPLRSEFKPPPILLSRKGPIIQTQSPRPPTAGLQDLSLNSSKNDSAGRESSEDEEEVKARELTLAERQARAARDREEKQRKYEERRQELFGTSSASTTLSSHQQGAYNKSGTSSPGSSTPPGSRSATPNRGRGSRGGRRGAGGVGGVAGNHNMNSRNQSRGGSQHRELYDPSYASRPDSTYPQQRREWENGVGSLHNPTGLPPLQHVQEPIRAPRGPDGSGRGGFGFAVRVPANIAGQAETATTVPGYQSLARRDLTAPSSDYDATRTTS
ncbi:hypothetical protein AYO21_01927 [Fonsecaea monophora]|uniref:Uncharacterized protein n=1 Tax=Fonsecaea monophora TaxID=254056 RepID=A0A177FJ87_9EURO|nr:hypothetical protein AYO21_01927 [Fonsecaea monophora]KAH0844753.1 hypothetical protein FOPE_09688 [Fonsecaea pedrosoi]OAG43700.1 hypothetical protein AYO21_01927 [Fonsecaea monophora]